MPRPPQVPARAPGWQRAARALVRGARDAVDELGERLRQALHRPEPEPEPVPVPVRVRD